MFGAWPNSGGEIMSENVKLYNMEFARFAEFYSQLGDGSYQAVLLAQVEHCFLFTVVLLVPQAHQLPSNASRKFMNCTKSIYIDVGFKFATSNDPKAQSFSNISQTIVPEHRIMLNSCTFDRSGLFQTSLESFGRKTKAEILAVRDTVAMSSSNYAKAYLSWLSAEHVAMNVLVQCDLYDLRSTQFLKPQRGRTWVVERTMVRKMARELDRLVGGPKVQYRGVRWRPERKHPWVAEIKLPRRKKVWIGNFDTQDEAARAYDLAAFYYQHCESRRNFQDDVAKHKTNSASQSILNFEQHVIPLNPSQVSTFYYADYDECDNFGESPHQVKQMGVQGQDKSVRHTVEINDFLDSNSKVVEVPKDSQFCGSNQLPIDISTCSQKERLADNHTIDSLYMFAKDLPSMTECLPNKDKHVFLKPRVSFPFE